MPVHYRIRPLLLGQFTRFPLKHFLEGAPDKQTVAAPCLGWLAYGSNGEIIVVDTGPGDPSGQAAILHHEFTRSPEQRIDRAIEAVGTDPGDVGTVVFSHLHFDHCADAELLPNARFVVHKDELRYAVAPRSEHASAYDCGLVGVQPAWLRIFDRLEIIERDADVLPGASIIHTPGHSPGSLSVCFDTKAGRYAVAGDLVNRQENWQGNSTRRHILPGFISDRHACEASMRKLDRSADTVLASHDERSLDHSMYP